jgi:hypothetical protein
VDKRTRTIQTKSDPSNAGTKHLVEPFIEAAFNILPAKSRTVLFERMLTIVYVAQDSEIHSKFGDTNEQALTDLSGQLKK